MSSSLLTKGSSGGPRSGMGDGNVLPVTANARSHGFEPLEERDTEISSTTRTSFSFFRLTLASIGVAAVLFTSTLLVGPPSSWTTRFGGTSMGHALRGGSAAVEFASVEDLGKSMHKLGNLDTLAKLAIHFVRHGEVDDPPDICYGRLPGFRLSTAGLAHAQGTGAKALASAREAVTAIGLNRTSRWFVSPLLRTRQTAAAVAENQPDYAEIDTELYSSSVVDQELIEVMLPLQGHKYTPGDHYAHNRSAEGFETFPDVLWRLKSFVGRIVSDPKYAGTQVVAVTHSDIIYAARLWASIGSDRILAAAPSIPASSIPKPDYASVTTLLFNAVEPLVQPKWLQHSSAAK